MSGRPILSNEQRRHLKQEIGDVAVGVFEEARREVQQLTFQHSVIARELIDVKDRVAAIERILKASA